MAVAVVSPTEIPETIRARIRPAKLGSTTNTMALRALTSNAGTKTRRRPIQSDRWPPRNRLAMTPTAYTAYTTVTMKFEIPSRC